MRSWTGSLIWPRAFVAAACLLGGLVGLLAGSAFAQSPKSTYPFTTQCHARAVWVEVDEVFGGEVEIDTYPNQSVTITFEKGINVGNATYSFRGFAFQLMGNEVQIVPRSGLKPGTRADTSIPTNKFPLKVKLHIASDPSKTTGYVYVTTRTREQFCAAVLATPLARLAEFEARHEALEEKYADLMDDYTALQEDFRKELALAYWQGRADQALTDGDRLYAVPDLQRQSTGKVTANILEAEVLANDEGTLVFFEVNNGSFNEVPITDLLVSNQTVENRPVHVLAMKASEPENAEHVAVIPKQTRVRGVFLLPAALENSIEPLTLELRQPNGLDSVIAAARTWRLRPVSDEELERERKARQLSVSARLIIGPFWIDDGLGQDERHAAFMTGIAVHFQKGFTNGLAVYGEAAGGWTGEASFADVTLDGADGELTRKALFGRLHIGGAVRFGEPYLKTMWAGFGVQGVRHESRHTPSGGVSSELEPVTDFEGFFTFGADVQKRFGDHVSLGVGASAAVKGSVVRTLEVAAQLSYAWDSAGDEPNGSVARRP